MPSKNCYKYSFDYINEEFDRRGYDLISTEEDYRGVTEKLEYICRKHPEKGIQKITFSKLINGRGCWHCGHERSGASHIIEQDEEELKALCEKNDFEYLGYYRANKKIWIRFICNNDRGMGEQVMQKGNMQRDISGCKYCRKSRGEKHIVKELEKSGIRFEREKIFP